MSDSNDKVLGVISLVSGIAALVFTLIIPVFNILLALVAIVCGAVGYSQNQKYSLAGLLLGIAAIIITILVIIAGFALFGIFTGIIEESVETPHWRY